MNFVNLTPHAIVLNNGTTFPPSGTVARINTSYSPFDDNGISTVIFGTPEGLPEPRPDTTFIVSGLFASAVKREDVVSPATGHPQAVRKDGQIVSVPGFVR